MDDFELSAAKDYISIYKGEINQLKAELAASDERYRVLRATASHAWSEWEGGSHREAIVAMEALRDLLIATCKP